MGYLLIIAALLTPTQTVANEEIKTEVKEEVLTVDELITEEFGADSIMHRVAYCESGKRQFYENGELVTGRVHSPDTGVFQINKKVWLKRAEELAINIDTAEGNVKMARVILEEQGLSAWNPSKKCWNK